jgi:hypothetical protein
MRPGENARQCVCEDSWTGLETRPTVTQIALAANLAALDAQILPLAANQMRRVFTAGTHSASTPETAPV